jgi:hypothetical protein
VAEVRGPGETVTFYVKANRLMEERSLFEGGLVVFLMGENFCNYRQNDKEKQVKF